MSEGICDFSIDADYDGDVASFYDERIVTARKPHQCTECGETIPVKAKYQRVTGKWDGRLDTYHFCLMCHEASGEFFEGGERCFGVLWDEMISNWEEGAHLQACLNRLTTVAAKEHMRRQWMKWKGLA
jgi:hypothetical protein